MKKICLVLIILLAAGSLVFAGGGQQGGSSSGGASGGTTAEGALIGIAMPETTVLRWVKDGASLKAEAEKRGYRAEVQFGNGDQVLQNQQIGNLLTQGAKLLVVGQLNDGVASAVADAARDKVAVIAYDRIIQNSADYDYYLTFNNFKVGQLQGQGLEAGLNLKAATAASPKYITLFAGSPTDGNAFFFYDGAMSVLNPYIKSGVLKVVGPYPETSKDTANFQRIATEGWLPNIAKTRMENLLSGDARNVTLDAVLAPNDTLARAIIEAVSADAKYASKLPVVSGQDAEAASLAMIKNGQQYMTVFKDTAKLAEAAIILADQILKGVANPTVPGAVLASTIGLESIGDTGKKVVKAYLLDPVNITQANWRDPITAGFITPEEVAANGLQ
ncbi:MAG: sugar-binding protein [Spirochaetaceae bacterium]|jgi:putative multiple sugar transport system substrate-binding protein|nr:sugar-binding protein [Spirochaetaceae bacterium]